MLRRLFTFASALSLLLFAITVVLWVRSYSVEDTLSRTFIQHWPNREYDPEDPDYLGVRGRETIQSIAFYRGRATVLFRQRDLSFDRETFHDLPKEQVAGVHYAWQHEPAWTSWRDRLVRWWRVYWGAGLRPDPDLWGAPPTLWETEINLPMWEVAAMLAAIPTLWMVGTARQRRHASRRNGNCPACGYDLRASADRCPECGAPVPNKLGTAG